MQLLASYLAGLVVAGIRRARSRSSTRPPRSSLAEVAQRRARPRGGVRATRATAGARELGGADVRAARRAARGAREGDPRRARGADRARDRERRQHARRREVRHRRRRGHALALRRARREARQRARCSSTASRSRSAAPRAWAASTCGRARRASPCTSTRSTSRRWGLCEKLACALLAGMPVIAKPATATALVAHRHRAAVRAAPARGRAAAARRTGGHAARSPRTAATCVAFTGGSATATHAARHAKLVEHACASTSRPTASTRRCSAPTSTSTSETGGLFLADVVRDMTQKTGQKCTAIRRVLVPEARLADVCEALRERLAAIIVGDPSREDVRMGPVATAQQLDDVRAGIARLAAATDARLRRHRRGHAGRRARGQGLLRRPGRALDEGRRWTCAPLNEHEVFGPVSTVAPYSGDAAYAADVHRARRGLPRQLGVLRRSRLGRDVRRRRGAVGGPALPRLVEDGGAVARARAPCCRRCSTAAPAAPAAAKSSAASAACTSTCSARRSRATRACSSR